MNYTNIFASLETDAKKLNIEGDWKKYFYDKPYPDHYKQSWLIKRLIDLEATVEGKTFKTLEARIRELEVSLAIAERKKNDAENALTTETASYKIKLKNQQSNFDYLIELKDKKIWKLDDYYTGELGLIVINKKLVEENMTMEKQINLLDQARSAFAIELLQTQTKLEHARQDLNEMTLDKNHIQGELNNIANEFKKIRDWVNRPMITIGTQTSLNAQDIAFKISHCLGMKDKLCLAITWANTKMVNHDNKLGDFSIFASETSSWQKHSYWIANGYSTKLG